MNRKATIRSRGTKALLRGLAELEEAVAQGLTAADLKQRFPSRQRALIPEPGRHTPASVRTLRQKIGASQADFASLVGVSRMLVQGWERGVREPSPLARRLLDTISADPDFWLAGLGCPKGRAG